jgi:hypothetical protein
VPGQVPPADTGPISFEGDDMAEKTKKLSDEDQKALEAAQETIKRLTGAVPVPAPEGTPVLKTWRVLLHGVTWDQKTGQYYDNTCRHSVQDEKGEIREVTIDRALVTAYFPEEAKQKFYEAWKISSSEWAGTCKAIEVRKLTELERAAPPKDVFEMPDNVIIGVPSPKVLPIRSEPMFGRPVPSPVAAG